VLKLENIKKERLSVGEARERYNYISGNGGEE
jgi:hypothetical protein